MPWAPPYQASSSWEILWKSGKILKPFNTWNRQYSTWTTGYPTVTIYNNGIKKKYMVSRIIASVFHWLDIDDPTQLACHKDDDPMNNREDNIFVGTQKDNIQDMIKKWRGGWLQWDKNWRAKFTDEIFVRAIEMYNDKVCMKDIARVLWIPYQSIKNVVYWNSRKYLFHLVSRKRLKYVFHSSSRLSHA